MSAPLLTIAALAGATAAATAVPTPTAHFNDWAGFVSAEAARRMDGRLAEYQRTTGHHVVVAIFPSLPDPDLEGFTVRTAQAWGVGGGPGRDDGVVLFVFAANRRMRIEVGYGLEGAIPDARAKAVIEDTIAPRLRQGQPDAALEAGIEALMAAADGRAPTTAAPSRRPAVPYSPPPTTIEVGSDDLQAFLALPIGIGALTAVAARRARARKHRGMPTAWAIAIVVLTALLFAGLFLWYGLAVRLSAAVAGAALIGLAWTVGEKDTAARRWRALAPAGVVMAGAAVAPGLSLFGGSLRAFALLAVVVTLLLVAAASTRWWWLRLLCIGEAVAAVFSYQVPDTYLVALVAWPPAWLLIGYLLGGLFTLLGRKPERWWIPATGSWGGSSRGYSSRGYSSSSSGSSSSSYSGGGGRFGGGGASGGW